MIATKDRAAFTLSKEVKAQLESTVPKSRRSNFVEATIADALMRETRRKALEALDAAPRAARALSEKLESF